ncbi:hypothetical protein Fot_15157 [Forsythia ovata]|uniref:Uncharacterized protein n=1 Tax=Forsythia ovata TaxID=205694 RepID=A0ABD1W8C4_9LAMI
MPKKKYKEEEPGWYYIGPWRAYKPLVTDCPSSIKQWKESWFWVNENWQRVDDDPEPDLDVPSVYGIASEGEGGELLREKSEASKAEAGKLRENLEESERRREEAKAEAAKLFGEKKELEWKLENAEADFTTNIHHIEAYTNFSNYFASVGQQEVMEALRSEHLDLDITSLEDKFPHMYIEDKWED